ncbi:unnamed protein product [Symbiodinium natans]|uniref:Uncharacterized protein n=1 Tax=Symbiodinium natans TaxID=878477 RepID=A0A812JSB5_9DINO|nr:unnamed protein product [Symbiodinium natans]
MRSLSLMVAFRLKDYDASGFPGLYRETCVSNEAVCPCGTNAQQCHDPHWDYHYCYPLVDYWTNSTMRCPVYCTDEQDYCYSPSYDANGNWLSTVESCVTKGTQCQCTGQNSFACDFNEWGYSWRECLPLEGGFCPQTCATNEVSCPSVEDYMPNGTWLGFSDPSTSCAANLDSCPCGKEAKFCSGSTIRCIFKDEDCPVICTDSQKKCYITDYTAGEEFISDREVCVASNATCPCGKNTQRCPGSDACLLPSSTAIVCPCGEAEQQCDVLDYTTTGKKSNITTQCVNKGIKCPCGKNTLTCADPNDAEADICTPKYSGSILNSCPKPCTPSQEATGNRTCIQTHLSDSGDFVSETISCVPPANCLAGQNMQKCLSGAHVPVWKQCKDLYNVGGSNASAAVASGEQQTSKVFLSLGSTGSNALEGLENARVSMNGELYLPKGHLAYAFDLHHLA